MVSLIRENYFHQEIFNIFLLYYALGFACVRGIFSPYGIADIILRLPLSLWKELAKITAKIRVRLPKPPLWKILVIGIPVLSLATIWFWPFTGANCGEAPVVKFRFQVWEYQGNDYGSTHLFDVLFQPDPSKIEKYGHIAFFHRMGGASEYFGLKDPICRMTGKPPTRRYDDTNGRP